MARFSDVLVRDGVCWLGQWHTEGGGDLFMQALEVGTEREELQVAAVIGLHRQQYAASREVAADAGETEAATTKLKVKVTLLRVTDVHGCALDLAPVAFLVHAGKDHQAADSGRVDQADLQKLRRASP